MSLKCFGADPGGQKDYDIIQFLFFGNIAAYKGLGMLIKAVRRLSLKYDNFRLTIAGKCGDWETVYAPMIDGLKCIVADIRFIGNAEIPGIFSSAHYLILPYRDVTQSGPLMIAYNYDVPVIASDLDGFREYIGEGVTGFMFDAGRGDLLEEVLEKAILRKKEAYDHLVNKLKSFVSKQYAAESVALRYSRVFEEVYEN
jgi:glycosyltransferase involved in cell wall biosynthesis